MEDYIMILKGQNENKTWFILYSTLKYQFSNYFSTHNHFLRSNKWIFNKCHFETFTDMFIMNSYTAFIITSHYSKFFSNTNFPLQQLFEGVIHYCYHVLDVWKLTNANFKWFFQCSQLENDRTEVTLCLSI